MFNPITVNQDRSLKKKKGIYSELVASPPELITLKSIYEWNVLKIL